MIIKIIYKINLYNISRTISKLEKFQSVMTDRYSERLYMISLEDGVVLQYTKDILDMKTNSIINALYKMKIDSTNNISAKKDKLKIINKKFNHRRINDYFDYSISLVRKYNVKFTDDDIKGNNALSQEMVRVMCIIKTSKIFDVYL